MSFDTFWLASSVSTPDLIRLAWNSGITMARSCAQPAASAGTHRGQCQHRVGVDGCWARRHSGADLRWSTGARLGAGSLPFGRAGIRARCADLFGARAQPDASGDRVCPGADGVGGRTQRSERLNLVALQNIVAKVQHGHWQPSDGKVLLSGHVSDVASIQHCLLLRILSDPID